MSLFEERLVQFLKPVTLQIFLSPVLSPGVTQQQQQKVAEKSGEALPAGAEGCKKRRAVLPITEHCKTECVHSPTHVPALDNSV